MIRAALLCLALAGCASGRYLTKQEDADMRNKCERGCVIVPAPIMLQLLERLKGGRI